MRFLIIKTSALGDITQLFPVIHYLRNAHPDATIDWMVENAYKELVTTHPDINQAWPVHTKDWRRGKNLSTLWDLKKSLRNHTYDVVFDLQGNVKSGLLLSLVKSKHKVGFAYRSVPEFPNLFFTHIRYNIDPKLNMRLCYLSVVQQFFNDTTPFQDAPVHLKITTEQQAQLQAILNHPLLSQKPLILVAPGSNWVNKQMDTNALAELLHNTHKEQQCSFLFSWGMPQEKEISSFLQKQFPNNSILLDRLPLPVFQNLLGMMDLVISMDSLPLHLAATAGTPTFSVFGPSSANKYKPLGNQHTSIQGSCPYHRSFDKRCPILRTCKTGACMKEMKVLNTLPVHIKKTQGTAKT